MNFQENGKRRGGGLSFGGDSGGALVTGAVAGAVAGAFLAPKGAPGKDGADGADGTSSPPVFYFCNPISAPAAAGAIVPVFHLPAGADAVSLDYLGTIVAPAGYTPDAEPDVAKQRTFRLMHITPGSPAVELQEEPIGNTAIAAGGGIALGAGTVDLAGGDTVYLEITTNDPGNTAILVSSGLGVLLACVPA